MKCSMCENNKSLKKCTITVKYKESGLDNITLVGIDSYQCDKCGEGYYNYGNLEKLHTVISNILLKKADLLTGKEIRFLRKHLGYSGSTFAQLIGYSHETISRIETGAQSVTEAFDRLIRFLVASKLPDRGYDLHDLLLNHKGEIYSRIELTHSGKNNQWLAKLLAA